MGFLEDVDAGLSANRKAISSRYFYDANGDKIFQAIMHMPEYYLTDVEHEIFSTRAKDILKALDMGDEVFDLVEFGAGDGLKTKILIDRMIEANARFRYVPIDISGDVLKALKSDINNQYPDLEVYTENKEYFSALEHINQVSKRPKLILFIGSSIGNFLEDRTRIFLNSLWEKMRPGDKALIGFDLQKDPKVILKAYNDPHGITKAFNLNILARINNELDATFDLDSFDHYPTYDPDSGLAKSYLVSLKQQSVNVGALGKTFHFAKGETIHTEISRKYTIDQIEDLFKEAKFKICEHFFDCKHYYVDTLAEKPRA